MGDGNFWPPTESTPLNRSPKNLSQVITSATPTAVQLCQIWCTSALGGFWANGWNITKIIFIYALFVLGSQLQYTDASMNCRAWWLERHRLAQGCAFLGFRWYCSPFRVKSPKTPILGAWIGVFKPNSRNRKTCIFYQSYCIDSNQILHSDKDHQMPFVSAANTHNKSKMADGRHLEKSSPYLGHSLTDFDQIWHGDAVQPSWAIRPLKISNLKNPR